jgi:hypothetical protein
MVLDRRLYRYRVASKPGAPGIRNRCRANRIAVSLQDDHRDTAGKAICQVPIVESERPVLSFFFLVTQATLGTNDFKRFFQQIFRSL